MCDGSRIISTDFEGTIAEVRIYNAALSEAEMKSIINGSLAVGSSGRLTASWGRIRRHGM